MHLAPIPQLYHNLYRKLTELMPNEIASRRKNLALLMLGILCGRSVQLGRIAVYIPLRIKKLSIVRRLERFLDNGAVRVHQWYAPIAQRLLMSASASGEVHLIIDGTKVSFNHQLLIVALAYRRCALPIAWTWVRCRRGHSTTTKQLALLNRVRTLLPADAQVSLVGDCEFGHTPILAHLDKWHWNYVLRQSGHTLAGLYQGAAWLRLDVMISRPGTYYLYHNVHLTAAHCQPTNIMLCWMRGHSTPWLLATNLNRPILILRHYSRRMWVEEMFAHMKGHGFALEASQLRSFLRLSRLTLAVALLYVWLITLGTDIVAQGLRTQIDRTDRRDLSLFRIALDFLQQLLLWGEAITVNFIPIFGSLPAFSPAGYLLSGS